MPHALWDEPMEFKPPPLRTDSICIGTLQLASRMAALKAADAYPKIRCAMWAQLDAEIGIMFRGLLLSKPEFKQAVNVTVRYDALKNSTEAEQLIADALDELATKLQQ